MKYRAGKIVAALIAMWEKLNMANLRLAIDWAVARIPKDRIARVYEALIQKLPKTQVCCIHVASMLRPCCIHAASMLRPCVHVCCMHAVSLYVAYMLHVLLPAIVVEC